jgi:hypothetical protein
MLALQVIDHVLLNEPLTGTASHPHKWSIQLAHDADNQMRLYCSAPQTRATFIRALGLYNPTVGKPKGVDIAALDECRKQVARELELPEPISDPNLTWISNLTGATWLPNKAA